MTFLVDAQLPPVLARWITDAGHQAIHVIDIDDLHTAEDKTIWSHALALNAVILTKDEDFASMALQDHDGPVVVWLRVGNCSNHALQVWFQPLLPAILREIEQGQKLIEVR